jgi:hypothetical protein
VLFFLALTFWKRVASPTPPACQQRAVEFAGSSMAKPCVTSETNVPEQRPLDIIFTGRGHDAASAGSAGGNASAAPSDGRVETLERLEALSGQRLDHRR